MTRTELADPPILAENIIITAELDESSTSGVIDPLINHVRKKIIITACLMHCLDALSQVC